MTDYTDELTAALRSCRVDDNAPIRLLTDYDIHHVMHMIGPVLERIRTDADRHHPELGKSTRVMTGVAHPNTVALDILAPKVARIRDLADQLLTQPAFAELGTTIHRILDGEDPE